MNTLIYNTMAKAVSKSASRALGLLIAKCTWEFPVLCFLLSYLIAWCGQLSVMAQLFGVHSNFPVLTQCRIEPCVFTWAWENTRRI